MLRRWLLEVLRGCSGEDAQSVFYVVVQLMLLYNITSMAKGMFATSMVGHFDGQLFAGRGSFHSMDIVPRMFMFRVWDLIRLILVCGVGGILRGNALNYIVVSCFGRVKLFYEIKWRLLSQLLRLVGRQREPFRFLVSSDNKNIILGNKPYFSNVVPRLPYDRSRAHVFYT